MSRSHAERRVEKEHHLARLVIDLVEKSGVSLSPSTVHHRLAAALGQELSQNAVDRLVSRLEADNRRKG